MQNVTNTRKAFAEGHINHLQFFSHGSAIEMEVLFLISLTLVYPKTKHFPPVTLNFGIWHMTLSYKSDLRSM